MRNPPSLRSSRDFRRVIARGRRLEGAGLRLHVAATRAGAPARLGVGVRSAGSAVARNRIKRRVRAAFRAASVRGADVVVLASDATLTGGFQDLVRTMERAVPAGSER